MAFVGDNLHVDVYGAQRVGILGSGGLSHFTVDEALELFEAVPRLRRRRRTGGSSQRRPRNPKHSRSAAPRTDRNTREREEESATWRPPSMASPLHEAAPDDGCS